MLSHFKLPFFVCFLACFSEAFLEHFCVISGVILVTFSVSFSMFVEKGEIFKISTACRRDARIRCGMCNKTVVKGLKKHVKEKH